MYIFIGQDLMVKLDTGQELVGASVTQIIAKRPDGTILTWNGDIVETTKIKYVIPRTVLNVSGVWNLKSSVTFADGSVATGDVVPLEVQETWYGSV